jgi:hypothetical protein
MAKVFQVTDLHLRAALPGHNGHVHRLSRHLPKLLEALLARIATEAPDLLAVTGDLLDVPHALLDRDRAHDLRALVQGAIADYRLVRRWLEGLGLPWMVLPGNHDHAAAFDVVFGNAPRHLRIGTLDAHAFHDWEQEGNQALRLGESRRRFEALTAAATPATEELHLQHFVVHPEVDYNYPLLYGDAGDIAARAASAPGRRLLLSGHWHGGTPMVPVGQALIGACPAFCEPPHPYRVFEMTPGQPITWREEQLGLSFPSDRPLLLVDRPGLLTTASDASLTPRADIADILQGLAAQGHVAIASPWHAPESAEASWRGLQYLHDAFFQALDQAITQGDALCLYLPASGGGRRRLPAEPITTEATLIPRMAELFGIAPARVVFLTLDPQRRALAAQAGARCPALQGPAPDAAAILAAALT